MLCYFLIYYNYKLKTLDDFFQQNSVILNISPWNYPLDLAWSPLVPALLAGNCVINKPSEYTPLISLKFREILCEAGVPEDVVQVVVGMGDVGAALIPEVDFVCFTGSGNTGRKVGALCGSHLIPFTLELGGKDPAIVLDDADIERAAVVGHDWGGIIAFKLAIDWPQRTTRLALMDTLCTVWAPGAVHGYWFKAEPRPEQFFAQYHAQFIDQVFTGESDPPLPGRPESPWVGRSSVARSATQWADEETVATDAADEAHDTLAPLIVAPFWSLTVAESCCVAPIEVKLKLAGETVTEVAVGGVVGEFPASPHPVSTKTAVSVCRSKKESAKFLGIDYTDFRKLIKKFDIESFFEKERNGDELVSTEDETD